MTAQQRAWGVLIGFGLVAHGLGHAIFPMRGADVVAPGVVAPAMTALYVAATISFVAAGLGVLGVNPMAPLTMPLAILAGVCGLVAQIWFFDARLWPGVVLSTTLPMFAVLYAAISEGSSPRPGRTLWMRVRDLAGLAFLAWVAASVTLWPWYRGWGAAPDDWAMSLPGDAQPGHRNSKSCTR